MKSSSKLFYLFLGLTLVVVLLVFSILENSFNNEKKDDFIGEKTDDDLLSTETNKNDGDRITEDTIIEYENYYSECDHTIRDFELNKEKFIGMNKRELEESFGKNSNKEVLVFDDSRVIIKVTKNYLCPNHYIIGENEGKVAIYKVDENGDKILFKTLDQSIELLGEYDIEKLKKGIIVDNLDDIGDVIENFIS
ncbi:hypothetical protein GOQ29_01300 [Clostridium sp. D2Q-14]|uniref:BofC C-terminal domain-containing protein n=1 Tax=Anaeromonas gelatinilytica TaxID=2683194 RepID=UPI00193C74CB|nr:hypothetical protein [Anaeromonas gelatinilytica]MBS4534248.1 hypothetical protein [Anaeromonas gelatinilytica]